MKYAIMSDAHANPLALETALRDAQELNCQKYVFLGDITGYGYDAAAALSLVRRNFDVTLMGNHDSACVGREPPLKTAICPNYAADMAQRETLAERDKAWLRGRPLAYSSAWAAFTHGDFTRPIGWNYIQSRADAMVNFDVLDARLLFCGHTHQVAAWVEWPGGIVEQQPLDTLGTPAAEVMTMTIQTRSDCRYLINVGSIGCPRHDLCTTYAIYDSEADLLSIRRLPFDFKSYIRALLANGQTLPQWLCRLLYCAK